MTLRRPPVASTATAAAAAALSLLLLLNLPFSADAWSLSSLLYGDEGDSPSSEASKSKSKSKSKLPKVLSRDLDASVVANSWPTTLASPLCEAWAFYGAGPDGDGDEGEGDEEEDEEAGNRKWAYLDALVSRPTIPSDDASAGWTYADSIDLATGAAIDAFGSGDDDDGDGSGGNSGNDYESSLELRLLRYDLSLRAHSPLCELTRTLARDAAISSGLYDPAAAGAGAAASSNLPDAFAVVYPSGLVSADVKEVAREYRSLLAKSEDAAKEEEEGSDDSGSGQGEGGGPLLPGEKQRSYSGDAGDGNSSEVAVVLYGQFGTEAFNEMYSILVVAKVPFVVRFMGAIDHEEKMAAGGIDGSASAAVSEGTVLQGYGVRLDIRNIEYKVFDDKADDDDAEAEEEDDEDDYEIVQEEEESEEGGAAAANSAGEGSGEDEEEKPEAKKKKRVLKLRTEYLAGLNVTRLSERAISSVLDGVADADAPPLPAALSALQSSLLLDSHSYRSHHSQTVPPAWQRRDLSLQAAHAITQSVDPLRTLQDLAQNLPSYASTLVELDVPDELRAEASKLEDVPIVIKNGGGEFGTRKGNEAQGKGSEGAFGFYVNGRKIAVDRPSFNLFELMGVIREEDALLGRMERELGPYFADLDGTDGAGKALGAVRDMIEMGGDALEKMGSAKKPKKSDSVSDPDSEEDDYDDEEEEDEVESSSPAGKFRIDVGRGYRGAVLYANDVEKDAQYGQWPRSIQQMMMMAQFGGPPTVRRNLFTVLLVVDPTDSDSGGGSMAALELVVQLVQSNFPVRVGFLVVGEKDIEGCREALSSSSSEELEECPLDELDFSSESRRATARDVTTLLKSVQESYGGMMALSWMHLLLQYWRDDSDAVGLGPPGKKSSISDLMDAHSVFLEQVARMSKAEGRKEALKALSTPSEGTKKDEVTYGKALKFAITKNVVPGMGFINGIPLPREGDAASEMQRIVMEEQRNVMGMIMGGKITDTGPRSIYAFLLTGPGVYPRMHPILTESRGSYATIDHGFGESSLLRPKDHGPATAKDGDGKDDDVPAEFVVEAHLDLSSPAGRTLATTFLDVMDGLPAKVGEDDVSVSYRLVPTNEGGDESGLASMLSSAGKVGVGALSALLKAPGAGDAASWVGAATSDGGGSVSKSAAKKSDLPSSNCLLANGRVLDLAGRSSVDVADVEILLSLELGRARAVSRTLLGEHGASRDAVGRSAAFLGKLLADGKGGGAKRHDAEAQLRELDSPLHFVWNGDEEDRIQVKVTAILDPLSEPTQRVAPLLLAVRDQLRLPLRIVVAPRSMIGADDSLPITSYYRFVADPLALPSLGSGGGGSDGSGAPGGPKASFRNLPTNHVLTIRMDVPEPWDVQQSYAVQDTDNLRCDVKKGECSDSDYATSKEDKTVKGRKSRVGLTRVEYSLSSLLFFGQCYDVTESTPPNGLQLTMDQAASTGLTWSGSGSGNGTADVSEVEISPDGTASAVTDDAAALSPGGVQSGGSHSDTLVMKTVGYWQLRAKPGAFTLSIANNTRGSEIYQMVDGTVTAAGRVKVDPKSGAAETKTLVMRDFVNRGELLLVQKKPGFEDAKLFSEEDEKQIDSMENDDDDVIHVFSLATGHLYERFLKIMMLSVTKRTSSRVKFWLFENYLSPSFKASATAMAQRIGCDVAFVTYKWPEWLRGQTEKQRIIWGYKILFLDTLFPLDVKKIIYVDADQVVRGDLRELWDMDLKGAPYGYTPFCDSRETTLGFQFWRSGFWESHLRGRPYHISALYVVDLRRFRRELVGDKLRQYYQQLSADPGSLANLDQDLPNYAQHDVRIFSLPQEWLWCESWCSDETKPAAKTIDLCNNPLHKEPKVSMAKRVISGELFEESWVELDAEVQRYEDEYLASQL